MNGFEDCIGRTVKSVEMTDTLLLIHFNEGGTLRIRDGEQVCCEDRFMTTDDDINTLVGGEFIGIDEKPVPDDYIQEDEVMFIEIKTTKGFVTIVNHNDHNGYYGGFGLVTDLT